MKPPQEKVTIRNLRVSMLVLWIVSLGATLSTGAPDASPRSTLVQIGLDHANELRPLYNRGFDVWQSRDGQAQILVNDRELQILQAQGYEVTVIREDIQSQPKAGMESPATGRSIRTRAAEEDADPIAIPPQWRYHSYGGLIAELHGMEASGVALTEVIGYSVEGREIWAIKISDHPAEDEDEPDSLVVGGVHAREWLTHEFTFHLAQYLTENYPDDPEVRHIVDNSEIWIVPVVNPDGYLYTQTTDRFWRKNRRDNGDGTFGVDLNRNYDYGWNMEPGPPLPPGSLQYAGPAPFSEPETQAIRDLVQGHDFDLYLDYHSFGSEILYPWAFHLFPARDALLLHAMASRMGHLIEDVNETHYIVSQLSSFSGHQTAGSAGDWVYAELGKPSIAFELPGPGFDPPASFIRPVFEETLPAALYGLSWAVGFGEVENLTLGQHYRQILPAIIDANDGDEIVVGPGIYIESLTIEGKAITLRSLDPTDPSIVAGTIIRGDSRDAVLTFSGHHSSATHLAGLTLTSGTVDVFNRGEKPILENCTIAGPNGIAVQHYYDVRPVLLDSSVSGEVAEVTRPGLIAHWGLDEIDGAVAFDTIGGLSGIVVGEPLWQPETGVYGGALAFDGVDDCIQIPSLLNPEDPFSVSLWVRGGSPGQVILSQEGMSDWLLLDAETGALRTEIMAGGRGVTDHSLTSQAKIADGAWHHIGLVWDGSERSLFIDGNLVTYDTPKGGLEASANGLNMGCGSYREDGRFWSGMIDDVRIYDRALEP